MNTTTEIEQLKVEKLSEPGMVDNISFTVHKGEILGFFGLMGSGRTEMARMVFGLDDYNSGRVLVNNKEMPRLKPDSMIDARYGIYY